MSAEDNMEVVRRLGRVVDAGAFDELGDIFADDSARHDPNPLPQDAGIEEYRQALTRVWRAFSDAEWTLEDLLADGDRVVGRWSFRGTHDGPFLNIPPTGREVINPILAIYRIADGKITEDWHIFHSIGLWQALIQDIRELIDRATQPNPQSGV